MFITSTFGLLIYTISLIMSHEAPELLKVDENQGFVSIANEILGKCKIEGEVESLEQCSDSYFVAVYEGILGEPLRGVIPNAVSHEDKVLNCATVIDALSRDVLNVDLSHITGEDVVDGDLTSIQNLLEIFKELLDFILDVDENLDPYEEDEQNDSNLLSSDHEVITDVLKEELGSSFKDLSTQRKLTEYENARKPVELLSSPGSLIDTADISVIPKWSRSAGSSKSSECGRNSTDEIIRESELLECQLAREYPSLLKLNEKKGYQDNQNLNGPRETEKGKEAQTLTVRSEKMSLNTGKPVGNESSVVRNFGQQKEKCTEAFDEKISNGIVRITDEPGTVRNVRRSRVELRDPNDKKLHYGVRNEEEHRTVRDTREPTVVPINEVEGSTIIMDFEGLKEKMKAGLQVHREKSEVSLEDKAIQTTSIPVKEKIFHFPFDRSVNPTTVLGACGSKIERKGGRTALECEGADDPTSNHAFIELRNIKSTKETLKSKVPPIALGTACIEKEGRLGTLGTTHTEKEGRSGTLGTTRTEKEGRSGTLGTTHTEEDERSKIRQRDTEYYVEGEGKVTFENERANGSDTSGILWDDQLSPLDESEEFQGKGTGLSFDKVGISVKRTDRQKKYEGEKVGGREDPNGPRSPVHRHYHHHFHHPHGSSENLLRDLECATRVENSEDKRPRSLLKSEIPHVDPSSVYITKSAGQRNVQERSHGYRKARATKRDEMSTKRSVRFNDDIDMLLITNRLERLKKEIEQDEEKQRDRRLLIKSSYRGHVDRLNKERKRMEKDIKQLPKEVTKPSPLRPKRRTSRVSRDHTKAVYSRGTSSRKARYPSGKVRKRSTSCSPKAYDERKPAKQLQKGDVLLPAMLEEFPFLHLSPHTMQTMTRKQTQQLLALSKSAAERRQTKTQKVVEDAEKRQQTLFKILRKDLLHTQRMREQKERQEQERAIKSKLREKRHASARARRYYEDYQLRIRARLLKRRTREEQIFKNLFEDGLEIQKQRVKELRTYTKEQREMRAVRQQNELESLENYYRDQYSMLAEAIAQEKEAIKTREKAQEKVIRQMQRNLRKKLQEEVADIQETLVRDEDDTYFRRLDAERLRRQMQMTAFQNFS